MRSFFTSELDLSLSDVTAMQKTSVVMTICLLLGSAGCSDIPDFGGGSSVVPDVTFVAADSEAAAASDAPAESTGAATIGEPGSFVGKVILTGSVTALPPLFKQGAAIKDPAVCAEFDVPDERLVLGDGNGVKGVFIYLNKAPKGGKPLTASAEPFMFDQKNCRFFPHCVIVPVGQTVKVLSADSVAHNTHTYPQKNPSVNSGVAPGDREGKLDFTYRHLSWVLALLRGRKRCNMLTIIEKPIHSSRAHFGGEIPCGTEAVLRGHTGADGGRSGGVEHAGHAAALRPAAAADSG